jgi:hypothetical protein
MYTNNTSAEPVAAVAGEGIFMQLARSHPQPKVMGRRNGIPCSEEDKILPLHPSQKMSPSLAIKNDLLFSQHHSKQSLSAWHISNDTLFLFHSEVAL